jgi:hypothetical protein
MKDVKFCIIGYGIGSVQQQLDVSKRIQNLVKFLTDFGGACYLDKLPNDPYSVDVVAVRFVSQPLTII